MGQRWGRRGDSAPLFPDRRPTETSSAAAVRGPSADGVTAALAAPSGADLDGPARERLAALGERLAREIEAEAARDGPRLRHLLRRAERLDAVVPAPPAVRENVARLGGRLERADEERRERLSAARVLGPGDGGLELRPLVGSKAAALAEAARLGEGRTIPGWFVVTDRAFREALELVFELPGESGVAWRIYDVRGALVAQRDLGRKTAGTHAVFIRAPEGVAHGIYFLELQAGAAREVQKVVMLP